MIKPLRLDDEAAEELDAAHVLVRSATSEAGIELITAVCDALRRRSHDRPMPPSGGRARGGAT